MKKSIFDIIQNSLHNVLVIDDADSSISYCKNKIINTYEHLATLDELYEIYEEKPINLFKKKYDTKKSISLILDDGFEISLHEYQRDLNPAFLKISNELLSQNDNDILIYLQDNHCISENLEFMTYDIKKYMSSRKDINDLNGYDNCLAIKDYIGKQNLTIKTPAIDYCMDKIKYGYQGYLPAIGQLLFVINHLDIINYILKHLKCSTLSFDKDVWITSSESTWFCIHGIRFDGQQNIFTPANKLIGSWMINKISYSSCLPFFRKM